MRPLLLVDEQNEGYERQATELRIVQDGDASNLEDEKVNEERLKYSDLFAVAITKKRFDVDQVNNYDGLQRVLAESHGLSLSDCQLICVNDNLCKSFSYCRENEFCVLTTIANNDAIRDLLFEQDEPTSTCAIAISKFWWLSADQLDANKSQNFFQKKIWPCSASIAGNRSRRAERCTRAP